MAKKTIDDLPDEVLLNIFTLLDGSELNLCCLTQSRWNDLIGSSHVTMKKFYLKLVDGDYAFKTNLAEVIQLTRSYHSLWIYKLPRAVNLSDEVAFTSPGLKKILEVHGSKIKTIKTTYADIVRFEDLVKLTPLLESLDLSNSKCFDTESLSIPKLKHLKLYDCSDDNPCETLFPALDTLVSLEFSKVNSKTHIHQLLKRQSSLQFLKIKQFPELFQDDDFQTLTNVTFKLKGLIIEGEYAGTAAQNNNFETFLKLHRDTLESLSLSGSKLTSNIAELLFASPFKSMKSLELSVQSLSTEKSFYYAMPTMDNIKVMKFRGLFVKADTSKVFMSKFTSLETLDISEMTTTTMSSKFLKTIAAYQQNLEHLSIKNLFKGTPISLRFKNLKSFRTTSIHDISIWMNFVLAHLTLEEISVDKLERLMTASDVKSLLELPNLKRINFKGNYGVIRRMFEALKSDYRNLRSANLEIDRGRCAVGQRIHQIKIHFPSNARDWKPQKYDEEFAKLAMTCKIKDNNVPIA